MGRYIRGDQCDTIFAFPDHAQGVKSARSPLIESCPAVMLTLASLQAVGFAQRPGGADAVRLEAAGRARSRTRQSRPSRFQGSDRDVLDGYVACDARGYTWLTFPLVSCNVHAQSLSIARCA